MVLLSMHGTTVVLTPAAERVVREVQALREGRLSLVIGNGCCDATAPFLFSDYMSGPTEDLLCEIGAVEIYLDRSLAAGFAGREIVIDAGGDPQPDSFSCEAELGYRFRLDRMPAPETTPETTTQAG